MYFGWPSAQEHDGERAIRAGLAIVDAFAGLPALAAGGRLSVRVGIHTGPVVLDESGEVFGDNAHIAARVQAEGEPGTVCVTAATMKLVAGLFLVEQRGLHTLKGVSEPVALYRVIQPSGAGSRFAAMETALTPFVGRTDETAVMQERWERVAAGSGQVVVVVAEAGVGKSRLAYELRSRLADIPHTWLECACIPYTIGTPFHPVIALVAKGLDLDSSDSDSTKLATMERGLGSLASEENMALLAHFLGFRGLAPMRMSPELQRRKTLDLIEGWILSMAASQPLVLLVEDLHWCDASTLEMLTELLARCQSTGLMLLLTARPEFAVPWLKVEHLTLLDLARLNEEQARAMIRSLMLDELPSTTVDVLVERAEGVPLYVEELTKSVLEPASKRDVDSIPATLADSLMSRLDRLLSIRGVAQRAAVIGREFSLELLMELTGADRTELEIALARLCTEQILLASGAPPDRSFMFKHALLQEAAYSSLLKRTRQQLHGQIAGILKRTPGRDEKEPEVIARHYEQAGMLEASIPHFLRAGQLATQRSANEEAIDHLNHGLSIVESLAPSPERDRFELALLMSLGSPVSAVRTWAHPECSRIYTRVRELASTMRDSPELPRALASLAATYFVRAEFDVSIEVAAEAILAAEKSGDSYDLLFAHQCMGVAMVYRGDFREALNHLLRAIQLYDEKVHGRVVFAEGTDRGVMAFAHAALCWHAIGCPERAVAYSERGIELARRLNHPPSLTHAIFTAGNIYYYCEEKDLLRQRVTEMLELAERFGFPMYVGLGKVLNGCALALEDEIEGALATIQQGIADLAQIDVGIGAPLVIRILADVQRRSGLYGDALASVELGLAISGQQNQHFDDVELYCVRARVLLQADHGDTEAAEDALQTAIAIARRQEAKHLELRAANVLASIWHRRGESTAARELLEPIYLSFTEGFGNTDLKAAKSTLDALS